MSLVSLLRFAALLAGLALAIVLATLHSFNHFDEPNLDFAGACSPVAGVDGPGDLEIDRDRRRVFIASANAEEPGARGAIYLVDIDDPLDAAGWRDRSLGAPSKFRPYTLDYFEQDDVRRLFVVNETTKAVEIYDVSENGDLSHAESLRDPRLTSPGSIAATGPRSFYLANDSVFGRDGLLGAFEFLGRAPTSKVYFFNGVSWGVAAEGLRFADGLALSPAGDALYVTEGAAMTMRVFTRNAATGALTPSRQIHLPGAAEGVNVEDDGAVILAINPKPLARTLGGDIPSVVLRYKDDPVFGEPLTQIFASDGVVIPGASSADTIGGKVIVGGRGADRYLICDMDRS